MSCGTKLIFNRRPLKLIFNRRPLVTKTTAPIKLVMGRRPIKLIFNRRPLKLIMGRQGQQGAPGGDITRAITENLIVMDGHTRLWDDPELGADVTIDLQGSGRFLF